MFSSKQSGTPPALTLRLYALSYTLYLCILYDFQEKLSIFLKNINWSVVCNGHAVCCNGNGYEDNSLRRYNTVQSDASCSSSGRLKQSGKHGVFNQKTVNFRDTVIFAWQIMYSLKKSQRTSVFMALIGKFRLCRFQISALGLSSGVSSTIAIVVIM